MRATNSKLRKLIELPAREKALLALASAMLPLFWLRLRLFGLHQQSQDQPMAGLEDSAANHHAVRRIGTLINAAARHSPFPVTCLSRSLALLWTLKQLGVGGQLRIGVRLEHEALSAHAWVEYAGVPINDNPDVSQHFAVMPGMALRRTDRLAP